MAKLEKQVVLDLLTADANSAVSALKFPIVIFLKQRLIDTLMAPFYYHLGHYSWFLDTLTMSQQIIESMVCTYLLFFAFLLYAIAVNEKLQVFTLKIIDFIGNSYFTACLISFVNLLPSSYAVLSEKFLEFLKKLKK